MKKWLILSLAVVFAGAFAAWFMVLKSNTPGEKVYIHIPDPAEWSFVMGEIEKTGALKSPGSFKLFAEMSGYSQDIKPGKYEFSPGMSNKDVLKMLVSGRQVEVRVVIRSSWQIPDLVSYIGATLNTDTVSLLQLLEDNSYLSPKGWSNETVIAAFIPNTYFFYWNTKPEKLLDRMLGEYNRFWNEERTKKAGNIALSPLQVSILASIVEKETAKVDEMPVIAGVYLNRLKINMALQADPTVKFAIGDPTIRRVTGAMTEYQSPYNTYQNVGLPPGPICLPSIQAIDAVLNNREHAYMYFCAREDFSGYHNFTTSYEQHLQNSRKYQAALNKLGIR